jgi:hypothetical protein
MTKFDSLFKQILNEGGLGYMTPEEFEDHFSIEVLNTGTDDRGRRALLVRIGSQNETGKFNSYADVDVVEVQPGKFQFKDIKDNMYLGSHDQAYQTVYRWFNGYENSINQMLAKKINN